MQVDWDEAHVGFDSGEQVTVTTRQKSFL